MFCSFDIKILIFLKSVHTVVQLNHCNKECKNGYIYASFLRNADVKKKSNDTYKINKKPIVDIILSNLFQIYNLLTILKSLCSKI